MSDHAALPESWWSKLLKLEPAVVKGVVGLLVSLGLVWGADFTQLGEQLKETADIVGSVVVLLTSWWIRSSVTPWWKVAAAVDINSGKFVAGPSAPQDNGTPVTVDTV